MSLAQKTEKAFLTVIAAAGGAVIVAMHGYEAQENSNNALVLPCYDAHCLGGPEFPLGTGNFKNRVAIRIRSSADVTDAKTAHAANVKAVMDALHRDDLATVLSAAQNDFHCFGVIDLGQIQTKPQDRQLTSTFLFEAMVCETDCT